MDTPNKKLVFEDTYELIEYFANMIRQAETNKAVSTRLDEAHDYVRTYCMPDGWGKIVWHTILDDAIKMRTELYGRKGAG